MARTTAAAGKAAQTDAAASAETIDPTEQETAEIAANGESGADSAVVTPTPPDDGDDSDEDAELPAFIEVVVRPKKHVQHNGQQHPANSAVELPRVDAERLKARGVVDYLEDLQNAAQASPRVSISGGAVQVR